MIPTIERERFQMKEIVLSIDFNLLLEENIVELNHLPYYEESFDLFHVVHLIHLYFVEMLTYQHIEMPKEFYV